jgi:hypothetical protein
MIDNFRYRPEIESLCAKPKACNELEKSDPKIVAEIEAEISRLNRPALHHSGQGDRLYRDKHHLTTKGAKLMLLPFFQESLKLEK